MSKRKIIAFFNVLMLSVALMGFTVDAPQNSAENHFEDACKYGQCKATAASTGNQCKHCVSSSSDSYCYQHK